TQPTNWIGDHVATALVASDANGDMLTYSATGLPSGLAIDPWSGAIGGEITDDAFSSAVYIAVEDGYGGSDSVTFQWTIIQPTFQLEGRPVTATEGADLYGTPLATLPGDYAGWQSADPILVLKWGDDQDHASVSRRRGAPI